MKTISNRKAFLTGMLALIAATGLFAWGHPAQADTLDQVSISSLFCAKVDAATIQLDQLLSAGETTYLSDATARKESLAGARKESDQALKDARIAADAGYADQFKALAAQATTKVQSKAVATFQKTVTAAVTARRKAADDAITAYRKGIDQIVAARQATYESALGTMKVSINSALTSAKMDCEQASGKNSETVTGGKIDAARADFKVAVGILDKNAADMDKLASDRDAKISAADTSFQAAIDTAGAKLKAVLGQN